MQDDMNLAQDDGAVGDVLGELEAGVEAGDVLSAAEEMNPLGADATTDDLSGDDIADAPDSTDGSEAVEADDRMNQGDKKAWGGICDDKCCKCNVNSSKGYY